VPNSGPNGEWRVTTPEYWAQLTRPILAVKVWYAEGPSLIVRTPSDWDRLPSEGVQCVILFHANDEKHIIQNFDEYAYPGASTTKLGLEIERAQFRAVLRAAVSDEWRP
jgi:hypothetical protein